MQIASQKLKSLIQAGKVSRITNFDSGYARKRFSYPAVRKYAFGRPNGKLLAITGLRRTGKTVEMLQCAQELEQAGKKVLFLSFQTPPEEVMLHHPEELVQISELYEVLRDSKESGIDVVFLDEITNVNGFQSGNSLADAYARDFPIVVSGTDSLGMEFAAKGPALYDRIYLVHTSYIPFAEYAYLLPDKTLDDYIRYGGTLHEESPYKNVQTANEYLNRSIAGNITHSLRFYAEQEDPSYPLLIDLYRDKELVSAIQKIANKAGQDVTLRALRKEYTSAPIRTAFRNVKRAEDAFDIALAEHSGLLQETEKKLRELFDIKLNRELKNPLTETHMESLKAYLYQLGLLRQIPVYSQLTNEQVIRDTPRELLLQPGMLYCHAAEAIKLLQEENFPWKEWQISDQKSFLERLERQVKGDILEGLILMDTRLAFGRQEEKISPLDNIYVSKIRVESALWKESLLTGAEIDVCVREPKGQSLSLLEVKYAKTAEDGQSKWLRNSLFLDYIQTRFSGTVKHRMVIYNGESNLTGEILYVNAEQYLKTIGRAGSMEELLSLLEMQQKTEPFPVREEEEQKGE